MRLIAHRFAPHSALPRWPKALLFKDLPEVHEKPSSMLCDSTLTVSHCHNVAEYSVRLTVVRSLLCLIAVTVVLPITACHATTAPPTHGNPVIAFSARPLTEALSLGSPLRFDVLVENLGQEATYIWGDLSCFITMRVFDSAGRELFGPRNYETFPPPPRRTDQFVRLEPHHFIGAHWEDSLANAGITKPGQYRVVLEYSQPLPPSSALGLPVWQGAHHSEFTVRVE